MAKSFIKGLLLGGTLGGIGGLLFAPRKGSETLEKWTEPIQLTAEEIQKVQEDYQAVIENVSKTQELSAEVLPAFQKSLEADLRAFQFQAEPRIARINEHLKRIQQHFEDSPLKKPLK